MDNLQLELVTLANSGDGMKWKVLLTAPYMQWELDRFLPIFREHDVELVVPPVFERMEEEDLLPWVGDIDGAICGDDRFTSRVLAAAPRLKVISKWGTGIDSINQDDCRGRGIAVCNTPGAFTNAVSDSVLGYILCFARKLPWMDRAMRNGHWRKIPSTALHECTLGIIGVGRIGKAVARRAQAFGMRLLGNDPVSMPDDFVAETGMEMTSKNEVLARSDFVSLNCSLNPTSRGLMDGEAFGLMRETAVLINAARGPVVVEGALTRALQNGQIAGAALDVFEMEPLPADSPLLRMDNVMMAPHNANSSPEAWERVHSNTIRNLLDVLEGLLPDGGGNE